jgi:glutamate synthase domain-containing protein 3
VQPAPAFNVQHAAWRQAGADLLDKIGPAIIMTHSAGGPFGLLVAEARPNLVKATVIINGQCGVGLAENIMSGEVRVKGNASSSAGATGKGGLIVIEGDAGTRCGISMKGVDIVVGGSVGAMSAFMAQAGSLVVCGDAGANLGDSLYEARLYVQGKVESLGADCVEKKMTPHHVAKLEKLLKRAGINADAKKFKRYGSARKLYNFHVDNVDAY